MNDHLSDRYVHAVMRAVPGRQRPDLEPEIQALVGDAVEARDGNERAALAELGDPNVLAARYAGAPQHLIGPALYPDWLQIVSLLLPIVVPIIAAVAAGGSLIGGATLFEALVAGLAASLSVGLQLLFWVTLVFALIERFGTPGVPKRAGWSVDDLPELPSGSVSRFEIGVSIAANVLLIAGLVWTQVQPPITLDGERFALFDPALGSFWLPWFIAVAALEIGLLVSILARGRWTWAAAGANAVLDAAFAIPALVLLVSDRLFDAALVAKLTEVAGGDWIRPTASIAAVAIAVIVTWDTIDGFRKAGRASSARVGWGARSRP
jgi:hypothetical protein